MNIESTLSAILRLENQAKRYAALAELREAEPVAAMTAMIGLLDSPDKALRLQAVRMLPLFKSKAALIEPHVDRLAQHLQRHPDEWVRFACAVTLMSAEGAAVEGAFIAALRDSFEKVAQIACFELASHQSEAERQALVETLHHPSWRLRLEACKALITQQAAAERVVDTLEQMDREPEARAYDVECDKVDAIIKEAEGGQSPEWWDGRWGRMNEILNKARAIANRS